jgi:hypothetical protein
MAMVCRTRGLDAGALCERDATATHASLLELLQQCGRAYGCPDDLSARYFAHRRRAPRSGWERMLLHVLHETATTTPACARAQHMAHLKPRTTPQQVLSHGTRRSAAGPADARPSTSTATPRFFSLLRARQFAGVCGKPGVHHRGAAPATACRGKSGASACATTAAPLRPAAEFAFASPYVPRDEPSPTTRGPASRRAAAARSGARPDAAHPRDFEYETERTDVNTPALEALALRKGVCQDLAHVMLGCLRSLGLPARYVSGYLLTEPPPGQPRLVGSDASHAWVSVYLPAPTAAASGRPRPHQRPRAGEDYVTVASGRDYSDVSPMRGVIHGGAKHSLRVAVTVTPAESDAP